MHLLEAAEAIRESGATIEASGLYNQYGRFYRVCEEDSDLPPVWLSVKALTSLAELEAKLTGE